jgi:hypothetical protein
MADDYARSPRAGHYDEGFQQGQRDALVRMVQEQLQQLNGSLSGLKASVQQLREDRVTRDEYEHLVGKIEGLSQWRWTIAGALGVSGFVSQILPRLLQKAP